MKIFKTTNIIAAGTHRLKGNFGFWAKIISTLFITAMVANGVLANPGNIRANGESIDTTLNECSQPPIKEFTVRALEGRAFLNWYVEGVTETCVYLVLRSSDGVDYTTIGDKNGAASPNNLKILNCYIDRSPVIGVSYYQLVRINADLSTSESDVVILSNENPLQLGIATYDL